MMGSKLKLEELQLIKPDRLKDCHLDVDALEIPCLPALFLA